MIIFCFSAETEILQIRLEDIYIQSWVNPNLRALKQP